MASVVMDATIGVSFDLISVDKAQQKTATAAVAIAAGQFVFCDASLGTGIASAKLTDATAANAKVWGIAFARAGIGNPVTILGPGTKLHYAAPGTFVPGAVLYLDVTSNAGGLSTVATTGDAVGVARAYSDTDIEVVRVFSNAAG